MFVFGKTFITITVLAMVSGYYYNYYYGKKRKHIKKEINEVIMFYQNNSEFRKSKYSRCMITHSMDRLLYYLNSSRHTLDICMYVLTNLDVTNAILKLHYRGIKVRVIIDADMAYSSGSSIKRIEKLGIPVRWMKSTNLMHHKFCLIDAMSEDAQIVPIVITGSLNWTNQALYGNWENVLVTSQSEIVSQYRAEYERLWIMFRPVVGMT